MNHIIFLHDTHSGLWQGALGSCFDFVLWSLFLLFFSFLFLTGQNTFETEVKTGGLFCPNFDHVLFVFLATLNVPNTLV